MSEQQIPKRKQSMPLWMIGLFVLGAVLLIYPIPVIEKVVITIAMTIGFFIWSVMFSSSRSAQWMFKDHEVLQAAQENKGVLTPALLSLHTQMSIDNAKRVLDDYVVKGICTMEVYDGGKIVYHFPDFLESGK